MILNQQLSVDGKQEGHYHGTNTSPACHHDEAIHTIINSGQTFQYSLKFPLDQPPGLYWYHPHVHGLAEAAVQGGASGAIIVEGIENIQPLVSGLPERILIIRDQSVVGDQSADASAPSWDVSLNYVPVPYPDYTPAIIQMNRDGEEFWRVANASADTIIDLQLQFDGVPQPLLVVGLDWPIVGSSPAFPVFETMTKEYGAARARRTRRTGLAQVRSASGLDDRNRPRYTCGSPSGEAPVKALS